MSAHREKCVLWARLESETSTIGDNGTLLGTADYAAGKFGNGVRADADGEAMSFPDNADYRGWAGTLHVTLKPIGWSIADGCSDDALDHMVWSSYDADERVMLYFRSIGFVWYTKAGGVSQGFTGVLTPPLMDGADGECHDVTFVWDASGIDGGSNTMEIYWDKVLVASTTDSIDDIPEPASPWYLGLYESNGTLPFKGVLDNLKIFAAAICDFAEGPYGDYEGWLYNERKGGGHVIG